MTNDSLCEQLPRLADALLTLRVRNHERDLLGVLHLLRSPTSGVVVVTGVLRN